MAEQKKQGKQDAGQETNQTLCLQRCILWC